MDITPFLFRQVPERFCMAARDNQRVTLGDREDVPDRIAGGPFRHDAQIDHLAKGTPRFHVLTIIRDEVDIESKMLSISPCLMAQRSNSNPQYCSPLGGETCPPKLYSPKANLAKVDSSWRHSRHAEGANGQTVTR